MRRRVKPFLYRPGLHLALRTDTGYRPAMVVQDGGGCLVKVRYTVNGHIQERWVERTHLVPPPWAGLSIPVGDVNHPSPPHPRRRLGRCGRAHAGP